MAFACAGLIDPSRTPSMTTDVEPSPSSGMRYEEWESTVPLSVKQDGSWKVQAYRLSLHFAACAWLDVDALCGDHRSAPVAGQLARAAGSVAANIAEGYGRRSPIDRARYFEYALGSAAETRTWYLTCRAGLPAGLAERRLDQLASVTRLLLVMIKTERTRAADLPARAPARRRNNDE